ncbi:DUF3859 domain-containing protein [Paracoccus caeni]|uniref:DUF3859 domain-containing protein n=1 Tax=Paracoccus caeni TaxID=657651 RepID=A0A934SF58_9RHOB|nr:DUF3859 domain-containing protein [Paracoccus caeni]MBK4215861.1 DUF3859 domain-containing protein [Paracoccus caeni]
MRLLPILFMTFAGVANAAPALTDLQAGVFCSQAAEGRIDAPDTTIGYIYDPVGLPHIRWVQTSVPAAIGVAFGIRARAAEEGFPVTVTVSHPPFPGHNTTEEVWSGNFNSSGDSSSSFSFDYQFELVPGDWRITIVASETGKVLLDKPFTVVPPERHPHIVKACAPDNAIS